jgi:hypothetical protein
MVHQKTMFPQQICTQNGELHIRQQEIQPEGLAAKGNGKNLLTPTVNGLTSSSTKTRAHVGVDEQSGITEYCTLPKCLLKNNTAYKNVVL